MPTASTYDYHFKKACKSAGLVDADGNAKYTPRSLRHFFASSALVNGVPIHEFALAGAPVGQDHDRHVWASDAQCLGPVPCGPAERHAAREERHAGRVGAEPLKRRSCAALPPAAFARSVRGRGPGRDRPAGREQRGGSPVPAKCRYDRRGAAFSIARSPRSPRPRRCPHRSRRRSGRIRAGCP